MKPFKIQRILIPVDLSENSLLALDHAGFMAKLFKAEITLLHVKEPKGLFSNHSSDASDGLAAQLENLATQLKLSTGGKVMVLTKSGKISKSIVEAANECKADVVVMGTHGISGFEELFIGSNAYRVVTEATCPIITVQTHANKIGFQNILLPIDNSAPSREKLRYAVELAQHYSSTIHLLGILTVEEDELTARFNKMFDQIEGYLKKHEVKFNSELVFGENIAKLTMKYGEKINADLLMIMTEQEENLTGLFLGPFAQQVVNHSRIPVMCIKPSNTEFGMNMLSASM
jgi:nucleotide-binding universal stress UspA family protein